MYRVTVTCSGVPPEQGPSLASAVADEFALRPWHECVRLDWDGLVLRMQAVNDFDASGAALLDEFGDVVAASLGEFTSVTFAVASVDRMEGGSA